MKNSYKRKSVWITGGGSGLGKAMALECARLGALVAVSGRRADRLEETVRDIESQGGSGLAVPCDVSQEKQIITAVDHVINKFGSLDVAVANAAFPLKGEIETLEADDWRRQFEVNVIGAAMTAKHALPELRKTKGRLALVGSGASLATVPMYGAYCASKYALRALGQTLAMELHGSGLSCTVLYPGYTWIPSSFKSTTAGISTRIRRKSLTDSCGLPKNRPKHASAPFTSASASLHSLPWGKFSAGLAHTHQVCPIS
jgi:NAD(P)-dependent dehydrogenase (short-subunit alcohol dehydrogenase family)